MDADIATDLVRHYREQGWVVVEHVYTATEAQEIAHIAEELGWSELAADSSRNPVTVDRGDGLTAPRKVDWAFPKHEAFRRFALDERLSEVVAAILGATPYLLRDQVFLKPARIGSSKPWHQDQPHLNCDPADHVVAAWIALDDVDDENGCLRYVEGSHLGPLLNHKPAPGAEHNAIPDPEQARTVDWTRVVSAPALAGGVALHHPLTLHGSRPNRSSRPRRAYSTHWAAADVTCPDHHTLEWAYSRTIGAGRHTASAP